MTTLPFEPEVFRQTRAGVGTRRYLALPRPTRARVLVEAPDGRTARRVLAAMDRDAHRWHPRDAVVDALTRVRPALATVTVAGGPGSIESYVADHLGRRDIAFGWRFGPPRANRKPVGTVVAKDGEVLAYVKLGPTPLTRSLVGDEIAALGRLGTRIGPLELPPLLHAGHVREVRVLILGPVRHTTVGGGSPTARAAAEIAVAESGGITVVPVRESAFVGTLMQTYAAGSPLGDALVRLRIGLGDAPLHLGAWHGDWTPHNVIGTRDGIAAWDWERYATGVPVGFDPLHYWFTGRLESGMAGPDVIDELVTQAPALLRHLTAAGACPDPHLTAALYLLAIGRRYRADRQEETASPAGAVGGWLDDRWPGVVERVVERITRGVGR